MKCLYFESELKLRKIFSALSDNTFSDNNISTPSPYPGLSTGWRDVVHEVGRGKTFFDGLEESGGENILTGGVGDENV